MSAWNGLNWHWHKKIYRYPKNKWLWHTQTTMFAFPFLAHQCVPIRLSVVIVANLEKLWEAKGPFRLFGRLLGRKALAFRTVYCSPCEDFPPVGTFATPSLPLLGLAGKVLAGGVTGFACLGQKPAEMPEGTRTHNICSSSHHWWYH